MGASWPDQSEREKLYHWIGTNFSLGAPQTGQKSGGSSPMWMYPQTVHFHFFIGRNPPARFPVLISQTGLLYNGIE